MAAYVYMNWIRQKNKPLTKMKHKSKKESKQGVRKNINRLILNICVLDEVLLKGHGTKCRCSASGEGGRPLKENPQLLPPFRVGKKFLKHTSKLFVRSEMEKNGGGKWWKRMEKNRRECEIIILLYEPAAKAKVQCQSQPTMLVTMMKLMSWMLMALMVM